MFYKIFVSISVKQNLFLSVFVHECLMMLNDVEYTTFKMFVTQMSNYLFVISFELMLYKTLRYRLARALIDQLFRFEFMPSSLERDCYCIRIN